MSLLQQVQRGKAHLPPRILVYGMYSLKKIVGVTRGQMKKVAITWTNRWCTEPWLWQRGRQD